MLTIVPADTAERLAATRALCWDYLAFLESQGGPDAKATTQAYPHDVFARLMDDLAQIHAPPGGGILLAERDGAAIGCGMFHTLSPDVAEIKRVYVAPEARGSGAGRAIMTALIDACRQQGFTRILMDSGRKLIAARDLYLSLGFRLRGPYQDVPDFARDLLVYFEMELTRP